jgi:hypothetical protein
MGVLHKRKDQQMLELTLTMGHKTNPLVVHNSQLSIPTNPFAERLARITSKPSKQRTHEDHVELSRVEWEGGLYWDDDLGPYVPTSYAMTSLWQSAKLTRDGEGLRRAVILLGHDAGARMPIEYKGPRDIEGMWQDDRYRLVMSLPQGRVRVTRTRPRFVPWQMQMTVLLEEGLMNPSVFEEIATRAGRLIGIGEKVSGLRCRFETKLTIVGKVIDSSVDDDEEKKAA